MDNKDRAIYNMYFNQKKSCAEIARFLKMSTAGVSKRIRSNGWQARDRGTAIELRHIDDYDAMLQEYQTGSSVADLAKKYKVVESTVRSALTKRGVGFCKKDNSSYDPQIYEEYFKNNKSLSAVAKIVGLPTSSVQERFKVNGWKMRPRGIGISLAHRNISDAEIILLYNKYPSTTVVAAEVGLSAASIHGILQKNGIECVGNAKQHKNGGELLISEWLKEWGVEHTLNWNDWDSSLISNRWHHVDVYVPKFKMFIEFHGTNYHKDCRERDIEKKRDFLKGYPDHKWIVVTEREIRNVCTNAVAKENLRRKFCDTPLSVSDLNFSICNDKDFAMRFLDKFHVRGRSLANVYTFILSLNGVIVGVATFGSPQGTGQEYDYEFKRLALCPDLPKNTASWFISKCVASFDIGTKLITYIDSEHQGSCFRGAGWCFLNHTSSKNAFYFKNSDGETIGRRKAWRLGRREGLSQMQWAKKYGYRKVKEPPKQVFYIKVGERV